MINVLIVDDHGIVRDGLERLIGTVEDVRVAGTAADGEEAVRAAAELRPDVILMDLEMPGALDGIAATRRILADDAAAKVLILTSFTGSARILRSLEAGAVGYVLKDGAADDLIRAIRTAARGESPIDPRVARELIEATRNPPTAGLSGREREVLELIGAGHSNREIARRLEITERTVKGHLTNIYRQIGVSDRMQAAVWAREHLLVDRP